MQVLLNKSFIISVYDDDIGRGAGGVELEELEKFKWHEPEQKEVEAEEVHQF